ncbi:hypothetical protein CEXT_365431 [Caerostris extrusa]|uniref:Uncharacterized protein n=1 Tax=Caerostris extrusa TaxID=172846 RepID=A0AAV4PZY9_CAEEX|nr:hypothetical protein CEXT_365431 [Caerostris extrusa]
MELKDFSSHFWPSHPTIPIPSAEYSFLALVRHTKRKRNKEIEKKVKKLKGPKKYPRNILFILFQIKGIFFMKSGRTKP